MRIFLRIDDLLALGERILVVGLYTVLTLLITFNIATRNLLHLSFHRILEIAPALVLWLALLGATLGLRLNRHIRLELFLRFLPIHLRQRAERVAAFFGLIVMSILFYAALQFTANEVKIFGAWGLTAAIFPLFFTLAAFRFFVRLLLPPSTDTASPVPATTTTTPPDNARPQ